MEKVYSNVLLITLFFKQIEIKDIIQYEKETIIRSIDSASYQTIIGKGQSIVNGSLQTLSR